MTELWITIACLFGWFAIGCVVLASIDDDDKSLFKWAQQAPTGFYVPTVMCWPGIVWLWFWGRRNA